MSADRMRRVDEAMREVLSGAITSEIKDPRVGFVTVTAVETSPDLRHARVFVSVLGDDAVRTALDGRAGVRARLPPAARRAASCGSSTRRRCSSSTTTRPTAACGSPRCSRRRAADELRERRRAPTRAQVLEAIRETDRFLLTTHERPDGDAVGSLAAMQLVLAALGKDSLAFLAADEFPLPYEYRFIRARRAWSPSRPRTSASACSCSSTAGTSTARSAHQLKHEDHRDPQHRPPPRQHALRDDQPRRRQRLVHGRDGVGPDAGARRRAHAGDRRGALRRPRHRHRPLHVREHRAARARDGRRAARRRGGRPRHLPAALRGHAAGQARAARARADARRALRRRPAHRHPPHARGLPRHGRRRELLRGRRGPPALGRGHRGRRADPRPADRRGAASARSRCAPPTAASTSRASPARRAAAGTGARPASRPTWTSPSWSRSCAPSSPGSFDGPGLPTGSSCSTSRPGSRRTTWSPGCGGVVRPQPPEGRPRGHAGPVRDRAAARARRPRDARAAVPDGAAQALRDRGAAGVDLDHRRPRGRARAGPHAAGAARAPDGPAAPAPAGLQRGEDRRRARLREGAPRGGRRDRRARGAP